MKNTIFKMALAPWPYVICLFTFTALLMASGQTDNLKETDEKTLRKNEDYIHLLYDHNTPIPVEDSHGNETRDYTRKMQVNRLFGLGLSCRL